MKNNKTSTSSAVFSSLLVVIFFLSSCGSDNVNLIEETEHLNDLQVIGSHNSYKKAVEEPILNFVALLNNALSQSIEYEHIPLIDQLELGLRNLEFDVFYDPETGRYSNPQGLEIVQNAGVTPLPFNEGDELNMPGLKTFHAQDVDFRSHHLLFSDALKELKKWSDENQNHTPVFVLINAKDSEIPLTIKPLIFSADALATIDIEIRTVFSKDQLITPDQIRKGSESLEEAVLSKGWPLIEESLGKVFFVLDENEVKTNRYLEKFPGLRNAVMFVDKEEGNPEAGFMVVNDPVADFEKIQSLVSKGYMVRTRADSETIEARANNIERFENAQASGAQIISTDYYIPSSLFNSGYQVIFSDGTYERLRD